MNDNIQKLLKKYGHELFKMNINPKPSQDYCGVVGLVGLEDQNFQIAHVYWMVQEMIESKNWSDHKIDQWLGFIQGVLWCTKLRGILDLRNENGDLYGD